MCCWEVLSATELQCHSVAVTCSLHKAGGALHFRYDAVDYIKYLLFIFTCMKVSLPMHYKTSEY